MIYKTQWVKDGLGKVDSVVKERRYLFGIFPYWKKVWYGREISEDTFRKLLPKSFEGHLDDALASYKVHKESWEKHKKEIDG